jgi:DNA polymerase/3'-5' exonuclease PolX
VSLATAAQLRGWHWNQMSGLEIPNRDPDGPPRIVSQTEELIYEALGMPFIKPWERK